MSVTDVSGSPDGRLSSRPPTVMRKTIFLFANLWIAYHIFCVALAPVGMPPASPLMTDVARVARPYNEFFFLNHGYHYFAPDPGGSTLIQCEASSPEAQIARFRFPHTAISPRLLYHRYFMLAENVAAFPPEVQTKIFDAYARHFAKELKTDKITLTAVTHDPSSMAAILQGYKLSDPETYSYQTLGTWEFQSDGSIARDLVYDPTEYDRTSELEDLVEDQATARIPYELAPQAPRDLATELIPVAADEWSETDSNSNDPADIDRRRQEPPSADETVRSGGMSHD